MFEAELNQREIPLLSIYGEEGRTRRSEPLPKEARNLLNGSETRVAGCASPPHEFARS